MFEHQLNALLCCCLSFSFWTVLVDCIKILFIIYTDHATNEEVQHAIGPHDLLTMLKRRKLQWYGHVSCSLGLAKTILQGTIKGARRQDRQKKTWEDNIREWTGLEFAKSQRAVENRENGGNCLWRCVVSCGSTSFPWLVLFFGALLWGSMIHKHTGKWMWQGSASVVSWNWENDKNKVEMDCAVLQKCDFGFPVPCSQSCLVKSLLQAYTVWNVKRSTQVD